MAKQNYFIEGLSGTGKSTVCEELQKRGFNSVEADAVYGFYCNPETGEPTDEKHQFNWMWDLRKVNKDLNDKSHGELFICGGAMNQLEVESRFDKVFTLFLDDETLRHRLTTRTNNSFGKKPEDLARQLEWNVGTKEYAKQRGTCLIDASQPLADVVDNILKEINNTHSGQEQPMNFDVGQTTERLVELYGISNPVCKSLNTLANYAVEVTSPTGHYALKIYNPASRTAEEVQWEIDLTLHLIDNDAPVAMPVAGKNGSYLQTFIVDGQNITAVMFDWAPGAKPKPELSTSRLIGEAAAKIHNASDAFSSELSREKYDEHELIDDQLKRMKTPLEESGEMQRVTKLAERMRTIIKNPDLDYGIIHNDLTLDNVHLDGDSLTVFDLDSSAESWRAAEPWGVLKAGDDRFEAWLEGYRSVREFSKADEKAVAAFVIVEDIRNVVWKLGFAKSSRGKPLMETDELPQVVDEWLEWEREKITER